MKINPVKEDIKYFNEHKTKENYTKLLDKYNVYQDRHKCIYCNTDIFYNNIQIKSSYKSIILYRGYSHLTTRLMSSDNKEYQLCVCEDCLSKHFPEYSSYPHKSKAFLTTTDYMKYAFNIPDDIFALHSKLKNGNNIDKFIKKYGEDEGKKRWESYCNNLALSEDKFINNYGEDEGKKRWESYCNKQAITNTFEYKHEKYGWSREEFDNYNKSRATTLDNLIKKYGEVDGLEKWNNYVNMQRYTTSKAYFIKEYGEVDGLEKWNNFNKNRMINRSYSLISQELFNELIKNELFNNHEIYFAEHNYEYEIFSSDKSLYFLDFFDKTLNICIEFNGEAFHPNPEKYSANDKFKNPFNLTESLVADIWEKEQKRYNNLKNEFNIDTIVVWENEYKHNKQAVIDNIINKIKKILNDR